MYQNVVSKKVGAKVLFSNMDIVNVDLDNINPNDVNFDEDDLEAIIHVWLMGMRYRFKQRKAFKKEISKELMIVIWHPKR